MTSGNSELDLALAGLELELASDFSDQATRNALLDCLEDRGDEDSLWYRELLEWVFNQKRWKWPWRLYKGSKPVNEWTWFNLSGTRESAASVSFLAHDVFKLLRNNAYGVTIATNTYHSLRDALADYRQAWLRCYHEALQDATPEYVPSRINYRPNYARDLRKYGWPRNHKDDLLLADFLEEWAAKRWWPECGPSGYSWFSIGYYYHWSPHGDNHPFLPGEVFRHLEVFRHISETVMVVTYSTLREALMGLRQAWIADAASRRNKEQ